MFYAMFVRIRYSGCTRNGFLGYADASASGDGASELAFITQTGRPSGDAGARKIVRSHVMRQVGRARRKGRQVKGPLLGFEIEVPDRMAWDGVRSSYGQEESLPRQSTAETGRRDDLQGQMLDAGLRVSNLNASQAPLDSIDGAYGSIMQYSQDLCYVPETNPSEDAPRIAEEELPTIERLWAGRYDPFVRYPIKMNFRAHKLIDHSQ
jgi:hypothetical protein